ncbi:winged helix-turn-helix domain-containing protein [Aeromonas veronii]|uniref:winged helix-turn-helix domain-containing protein n=1 Tax=Aeromonas veronii TaxID=654 RepID=UPI0040554261
MVEFVRFNGMCAHATYLISPAYYGVSFNYCFLFWCDTAMSVKNKIVIIDQDVLRCDELKSRRLSQSEVAVLTALIRANGQAVNRDDLMEHGWPGKVVVPNALNMAVLNLRRALHIFDMSDAIITIPKTGFRLVSPNQFLVNEATEATEAIEDTSEVDKEVKFSDKVVTAVDDQLLRGPVRSELISLTGGGVSNNSINYPVAHPTTMLKLQSFNVKSRYVLFLFLLNVVILIVHSVNRHQLECVKINNVTICAQDIDEKLLDTAKMYIQEMKSSSRNVEIWVERNPHMKSGYKFYVPGANK